ncbi:MAG: 50S ribosomal protein L29 [Dehalococcoidia bacterium]
MATKSEKTDELRELSDTDLAKELETSHRQLFTTRLQLSTRQLANTSIARHVKRRIARIKTIQRERELAAHYEAAAESES